jgi:GTP-binding protein EngB required for normal cell division
VKDRIAFLKEKLEKVDKQSVTRRKERDRLVRVAIVGYTNVGKSTLMRNLSKADVFAENKLFRNGRFDGKESEYGEYSFSADGHRRLYSQTAHHADRVFQIDPG